MNRFYSFMLAVVALGCAMAQAAAPTGAVNGLFSVAADKQVYFSQGNLQCTDPLVATSRTWAFAEHQYDRIGTANITSIPFGTGKMYVYPLAELE